MEIFCVNFFTQFVRRNLVDLIKKKKKNTYTRIIGSKISPINSRGGILLGASVYVHTTFIYSTWLSVISPCFEGKNCI